MASDKNVVAIALFAKNEAAYNSGAALTGSTDFIQVEAHPVFSIEYAYLGNRAAPHGSFGKAREIPASGRTTKGTVRIEGKGLGSAYASVANTVPNLHPFLLASGFSGSLSGGTWTFAPLASPSASIAAQSLALELYQRGEKWSVSGSFCDMNIESKNAGPAIFEFPLQGLITIPTDVPLPAYSQSFAGIMPPNSTNLGLTIGAWTPRLRDWKFALGRAMTARVDLNSVAGHAGFEPGARKCVLTCKVEAPLIATFDAYTAESLATVYNTTITVGSAANNKFTITLPYAQITKVADSEEGSVAMLDLTIEGTVSAPNTNDDISITFN